MRINEITNAQDKLDLLKSIMDNTWRSISQQTYPILSIRKPTQTIPMVRSKIKAKALAKPKAAII